MHVVLDPTVGAALERATTFLIDARDERGWWRDFLLSPGVSDEWVTGYVGVTLARAPEARATDAAKAAWRVLADRRKALGRWGYNIFAPGDGDSTGWGVQLAYAVGEQAGDRALEARAALPTHQLAGGGFTTYADEPAIRRFISAPANQSFRGWCGPHACVTAALAAVPDVAEAARASLRTTQRPDGRWDSYWWSDHAYATALAAEALAQSGTAEDRGRVQRAVAWARAQLTDAGRVETMYRPTGSAFATALCLRILLLDETGGSGESIHRAVEWLVAAQRPDGAWPSSAMLRVPNTDDLDPDNFAGWVRGGVVQGSIVVDHARLFTTSTVVLALRGVAAHAVALDAAPNGVAHGARVVDLPALQGSYPLEPSQLQQYRRTGHLPLRAVVTPDEIAALRPGVKQAVMAQQARLRATDRNVGASPQDFAFSLADAAPPVRSILFSPRLARLAADLLGVDAVRLLHYYGFFKPPGGTPTPWHQDCAFVPLDTDLITLWLPLVDVPGPLAMTFARGSHKAGWFDLTLPPEEIRAAAIARGFPMDEGTALAAGDADYHSGRILHCAPGNRMSFTREVIAIAYYPDGARIAPLDALRGTPGWEAGQVYRRHIHTNYFPHVQVGEPAASAMNPIVFRR